MKMVIGAALAALAIAAIPATDSIAQGGYGGGGSTSSQTVPQPQQSQSGGSNSGAPASAVRLRPPVGKPMQEAQAAYDAKDYATALAKAREADAVADKTDEEAYYVNRFMGQILLAQKDYAGALTALAKAIATNATPANEKPSVFGAAMQLAAQAKQYAQAVSYGEMLVALGPLDERSAAILAQSYYNKGDHEKAMKLAQEALARNPTDPNNKAMLLQVQTLEQARSGNTGAVSASLEAQCAETCDGKSWGYLVGVAMQKVGARLTNHQGLNLLRLRLAAGGMEAIDYTTMAGLAIDFALPAEAKSVLEKGLAAGAISRSGRVNEMLSRANSQVGRDRASLAQFEREASASSKGEMDVKLGESYYTHGMYAQAETALRRGIGKGGVNDRADAQITLGIVLLAAGKREEAATAFKNAEASASVAPIAHVWALYAGRRG